VALAANMGANSGQFGLQRGIAADNAPSYLYGPAESFNLASGQLKSTTSDEQPAVGTELSWQPGGTKLRWPSGVGEGQRR